MTVGFAEMWAAHPSNDTPAETSPCRRRDGSSAFANQCCVRMGECLTRCGIDISGFRGAFCWHGHGKRHPLKVEQFKNDLNSDEALFAPYYAEKHVKPRRGAQKTHHHFLGRQGIVVFRNFYGAGGQGDHIDLWNGVSNGKKLAQGGLDYFERSKEIWFWKIP
ncbi:T6SS effector amidase Tae4 family protein [Rubrimonas cliftonensis]|uniref:Type VI secretion system (T6SS), amidase effector protein 4 n=1 Tax=Rubrimonas cliftonensis TaxID=89524 RepID=A0A1H4CNV6_9RHOB|nr:T6SS effector amidase Tae4 family protein [Rubrimonas cliftonensis]SEA62009.1 Type VI secretion system (T6SS), amidase effector protein 4 [Rubrimonas cliftonensis]